MVRLNYLNTNKNSPGHLAILKKLILNNIKKSVHGMIFILILKFILLSKKNPILQGNFTQKFVL